MKNLLYILFLLLLSASSFNANSQNALSRPVNQDEQTMANIKAFESNLSNNKAYLHITVNGNTTNRMIAVERSVDGVNYEVIGFVKFLGTDVPIDIDYYYIDKSPAAGLPNYRLSDCLSNNMTVYTKTKIIIPDSQNNIPSNNSTKISTCDTQLNSNYFSKVNE